MVSANYAYLVAVISVVTLFLSPFPTTVSAKRITITGRIICNMSCSNEHDIGINGAEVRVACSNETYYAQVKTKSASPYSSDVHLPDGIFLLDWPDESTFSPDSCAFYVDYIPTESGCNLPVDSRAASEGYKLKIYEFNPSRDQRLWFNPSWDQVLWCPADNPGYYVLYYPPCGNGYCSP